jgi:hypothetical protein
VVELVQVAQVLGVEELSSGRGISAELAQEILSEPLELSGIG